MNEGKYPELIPFEKQVFFGKNEFFFFDSSLLKEKVFS